MKHPFRSAVAAFGSVAMLASMAACGNGSGGTASGDDAESKELTISWYYSSGGGDTWERAIKLYKKQNPDVKINEVHTSFPQMQKNAALTLQADDAPDVALYNQGTSSVGNLASQGILADLSSYAEEYGWTDVLPASIQTVAKYKADDGDIMSPDGEWYGVPVNGEFVLAYYNQDMFEENGIDIPETFADLEAAMQSFVDKGITPVAFEGNETASQHLWYQLVLSKADRQFVNDYQSYEHDVDFTSEPFTYAAEKFAEWVDKGYLPGNSGGLVAEDMITQFCAGEYPIMFSGSWWFGRVNQDGNFKSTFRALPGNEKLNTGATGKLWVVLETSKHKDQAAHFLNFLLSEEVQNLLATEAGLPFNASDDYSLDGLADELKNPLKTFDDMQESAKEFNSVFEQLLANDAIALYPDWPSAGMYDSLNSAIQGLINGNSTPEQATEEIKAAYEEGKADLGL